MNSQKYIKYALGLSIASVGFAYSTKIKNTHYRIGVAGLLAQVATDFIFHPLDLINTRTKYYFQEKLSTITTTKRIYHSTGLPGFFRGGTVTIFGSSLAGFIYFSIYKHIKEVVKNMLEHKKHLYFMAYSIASIVAEVIVYVFYYPFDLIKTRIQTGQFAYKHFIDGVKKIWVKGDTITSIRRLYSGFVPSLVLSTSTFFLIFFTFELCRDYVANKRNIPSTDVAGLDYFICTFISGFVSATSLNFLEVYVIQKIVHGQSMKFFEFFAPKNISALTSGILARNMYGIFYTIFLLEAINVFGKIYNVKL